jgi:RNase H-fold protein (predicted Holliday junction resolvase)
VVARTGIRDVAKNETGKGLHQIKNFVENYKQTNVVMMSVPHRHDLEPKSCVNDKVKRFNRRLKKFMKVCGNARVIEVESERDPFTKHGQHMNLRG